MQEGLATACLFGRVFLARLKKLDPDIDPDIIPWQLNKMLPYKIIFASFILAATLIVACSSPTTSKPPSPAESTHQMLIVKHVNARAAINLLAAKPDVVILDVRTPKEFSQGHIAKARLVDFLSEDFSHQLSKLDRDVPYLVHCRSGGRSTKALTILEELGFTNITHLDGGFSGWQAADLPIVN